MELSAILVHYRTPDLLAASLAALATSLRAAGLAGRAEALVVDNGGGPAELAAPQGLRVETVRPGRNLGFAAGVNRGVELARGRVLVAMNPDVEVEEGCLPALLAELANGAGVAGPRFGWDAAGRLLLPPTEVRSRSAELRRHLASGDQAREAAARRAWRRHARIHWEAGEAIPSLALSGALLAIRRDAWSRVGPFDEGYRLYFEETDWLRRAARLGVRASYVPGARARHGFARSAAGEPAAPGWFAQSAERFARRAYGETFVARLASLDRRRRLAAPERRDPPATLPDASPPHSEPGGPVRLVGSGSRWLEVSPSASGFPAAAERLDATADPWWHPPPELGDSWQGGVTLHLREVLPDGTELSPTRIVLQ